MIDNQGFVMEEFEINLFKSKMLKLIYLKVKCETNFKERD